jgi:hypothetical protein
MNTLSLYDISGKAGALAHFVHELGDGTTLARLVAQTTDFARGRLLIALPEGSDLNLLGNFAQSNYRFAGRGWPTLANVAKAFIDDPRCAILFQETQASPDYFLRYKSRWIEYWQRILVYGEEVYWHLNGPNTAHEKVLGLIRSVSFNPFSAFFYNAESTYVKQKGVDDELSKIDLSQLQTVVDTICGIAVGVCDEDSFLLWWNDHLPLTLKAT